MRTFHIALAVLTLSTAASAFAEAPYPVDQPFTSSLSRAQVKQDLVRAEHQGLLSEGENFPVVATTPSSLSRRNVEQQVQTAQHGDPIYSGA